MNDATSIPRRHAEYARACADSNQQLWLQNTDGGWLRLDLARFAERHNLSVDDFLAAQFVNGGQTVTWPSNPSAALRLGPGPGSSVRTPTDVTSIQASDTPRGWYRPLMDQLPAATTDLLAPHQAIKVLCLDWQLNPDELQQLALAYPGPLAVVYQRLYDLNAAEICRSLAAGRTVDTQSLAFIHRPWAVGRRSGDVRFVTPLSAIRHRRLALVESVYGQLRATGHPPDG